MVSFVCSAVLRSLLHLILNEFRDAMILPVNIIICRISATRGSLEEFNPRASQLYKERAESSFASLIENFDSRKYLQSNALEQLRPRIEFERSLMQIKDLSDDEVHDETESFVNLEISVLRSVDHNRRSRSLQPCIDRRIICDDQVNSSFLNVCEYSVGSCLFLCWENCFSVNLKQSI